MAENKPRHHMGYDTQETVSSDRPRKQFQFDENKDAYRSESTIGTGGSGLHFADNDSMRGLDGVNRLGPEDCASQNVCEHTSVDVSRANRGKES